MNHIFLDANIFLQCKSLDQLPWGDITENQDAVLLIPQAVQKEIDKLKSDGNGRRSKRARKASSLFKEIIRADECTKKISCGRVSIDITFPPSIRKEKRKSDDFLDPTIPDDLIILDILAYKNIYPDNGVYLLTHDSNLLLTAKNHGIKFIENPNGWLLDPEPDEKDKKIKELENKISELKKNYPEIVISVNGLSDETQVLNKSVTLYQPLNIDQIESLIDQIKANHPMEEDFSEPKQMFPKIGMGIMKYVPPPEEDIERYQNELYPTWIKKVEKTLYASHDSIELSEFTININFYIENTGAVPANNVILKVSVSDGFLLLPPTDEESVDKSNLLSIPSPPAAPEGEYRHPHFPELGRLGQLAKSWGHINPNIGNLSELMAARRDRDRNAFYWKPRRPKEPNTSFEMECTEFRHKSDKENFCFSVLIPKSDPPKGGLMTVTVTAANLHDPVAVNIPLHISYKEGDIVTFIKENLRVRKETS
ncbi:MAG: PIN domain-containing protein [Betaproteobacteria bacterium]|nr:PIN domain-containing protein [Betaproteobacteria bacterium]